jgi:DNA-directed RNA polymerase alpha subunit
MEVSTNIPRTVKGAPPVIVALAPDASISRVGFSQRSFNALTKNGYDTVGKILSLDEESLHAIENLGKKSIKEILIQGN